MHQRTPLAALAAALALAALPHRAAPESQPEPAKPAPAVAVTKGPKHHFFGYYDKCPWDATGRYLLSNEVDFIDRQPKPGELLTVGMIDRKDGDRFIALDKTAAWCWQQGTMLQWLGSAPDREVIYNSVDDGKYISIIRDVHTGKTRKLPRPIYHLTADGATAVTLDFDRLNRVRPGYGYCALPEKHADDPAPKDAGIYAMDVKTGANKLILSLHWAANNLPDKRFEGATHWFNHLQFNPSGTRFIFLHRWRLPKNPFWNTRLYTAKPDGTDPQLVADDGMVSHFDWFDDTTILAWSRSKKTGDRFHLYDLRTGEHKVIADGVLTRDGHCSYSPDRKWILVDTYPDADRQQRLMLLRVGDGKLFDLNKFYLPPKLTGPYRCDLHPRWNRDGTQVCIDSAHEPTRQLYVLDVAHITKVKQGKEP